MLEKINTTQINILGDVNPENIWQSFRTCLENKLGKETFDKWLSGLSLYSLADYEVIMSIPSKFLRDWVKREYLAVIKETWVSKIPTLQKFSIIHIENTQTQEVLPKSNSNIVSLSKYDNVFALGTDLNPKFTFANFAAGKSNNLAFKAAQIIAGKQNEAISLSDVNPLYLHGGVGLGKTHLGQAIAWEVKENNKKTKAVYLSAERFMHQFVQSIKNKDVVEFKEKFRGIDLLVIDDLQFIIGKEGTQEELLYTISSLVEDGKRVVLICDRHPGDLNSIGEKLKSRISAGMIADFKCPDYETRLEILRLKAKASDNLVPTEVLKLLAEKINSNIRDLEGALKKLIANHIFNHEEISVNNTYRVLEDLFKNSKKEVTISDIKKEVCDYFKISIKDLDSAVRARKFARPRQIAMYLSKILTTKSLPDIGNAFKGKNHATVIHASKTIERLMLQDSSIQSDVKKIEDKIKS